jgi:hypothetical protein
MSSSFNSFAHIVEQLAPGQATSDVVTPDTQASLSNVVHVIEDLDNDSFDLKVELEYQVDSLAAKVNDWDKNVYTSAHQQLYSIQYRVFHLHKELFKLGLDTDVLRSNIEDFANEKKGLKFKKSSSCIYMLVSCVFASIPVKRRSAYALAMESIINNYSSNITEEEFFKIIQEAGGIYELAKPVVKTAVVPATDGHSQCDEDDAQPTNTENEEVINEQFSFKNKQFAGLLKEPNVPYVVVVEKNEKDKLTVYAVRDLHHDTDDVTLPALPQP